MIGTAVPTRAKRALAKAVQTARAAGCQLERRCWTWACRDERGSMEFEWFGGVLSRMDSQRRAWPIRVSRTPFRFLRHRFRCQESGTCPLNGMFCGARDSPTPPGRGGELVLAVAVGQ